MKLQDRIYVSFAHFIPRKYMESLGQQLIYAGETTSAYTWYGASILMGILLAFAALATPFAIFQEYQPIYILYAAGAFAGTIFVSYLIIYFKAEDRTKRVENALPDMLQLVAANLRAGMTPFKALQVSARKEFGPLKEEIEHANAKALGTASFASALLNITTRVRSDTLDRTLKLFTTAMRSGGHLAELLEELAADIRATHELKKELITNTKQYTMFIMFTVAVGTPLLLAIAIHFLGVVTDLQSNTSGSDEFGLSMLSGDVDIDTEFMSKISFGLMVMTSTLASMLLGVIAEGRMKYGFRYAPILVIASFGVFFIAKRVVGGFLEGAL